MLLSGTLYEIVQDNLPHSPMFLCFEIFQVERLFQSFYMSNYSALIQAYVFP